MVLENRVEGSLDRSGISEVDALMLACAGWNPLPPLPAPLDEPTVRQLCLRGGRRMLPLLAFRLQGHLPDAEAAKLQRVLRANLVRNLVLVRDLSRISAQFALRQLDLIALKGVQLALSVHDHLGTRVMTDLDLLIRFDQLKAAEGVLQHLGYVAERPYRPEALAQIHHHLYPYFHPGTGTKVELHWALGGPLHRVEGPALEAVWSRSIRLELPGGGQVQVMAPEQLLCFLLLHACHQHKFGFGPSCLADVAGLLRKIGDQLDWGEFLRSAAAWRCEKGAYLTLRICREKLGSPIPEYVVIGLKPADFEELWLERGLELLLSEEPVHVTTAVDAWLNAETWRDRIGIIRNSLFREGVYDAVQYRIPPGSAMFRFRWLRRSADLGARYIPVLLSLLQPSRRDWRRRLAVRGQLSAWLDR